VNDIKIEDLPRLVQLEAINNMHHINTYSKDIELSMKKTLSKIQGKNIIYILIKQYKIKIKM
jgi:hypothetical protein